MSYTRFFIFILIIAFIFAFIGRWIWLWFYKNSRRENRAFERELKKIEDEDKKERKKWEEEI